MVSTTITFSKRDVQPPVFVAGSFTKWTPVEMNVKQNDLGGSTGHEFSYETELQPGEYQYKFRLGPGDWWVLDDSSPSADDGSGNVNNVITVRPGTIKAFEPTAKDTIQQTYTNVTDTEPQASTSSRVESVPKPTSAVEEVTPAQVQANIGQKIVKEEGARDESPQPKPEKVNSHFDGSKEDPIPDIAPPPYSIAAETGAGLTSSLLKSESATLEDTGGRNHARTHGIKGDDKSKQSTEPGSNRLRNRNVALVIAIIVVPVAASFFWYR